MKTRSLATRRLLLVTTPAALAVLVAFATQVTAQYPLPPDPQVGGGGARAAAGDRTHAIDGFIGLVTKRDLAATEAGILTHVGVKIGSRFQGEDIIAEIDTREAEQAYKRAQAEYQHTLARANDEIEKRYAEAQEKVERADLEEIYEANKGLPGTVPEAEVRKEELEWKRAQLGGEKALKDQQLAMMEVNVKRAEMQLAEIAIEKRRVRAPFGGEVLKLHREEGEWVQPGDTIAEVARLDLLQVDGFVYFDEFDQRDIENCRVTVSVPVAPGRTEEATGYIVYVDPLAEYDGERSRYRVRAEIANRLEGGRWAISPNLPATMEIHLGTKGEGPAVGGRATRARAAR
ncbi:efflux RND transporter periplasmic adaptor subunit [Botrimarina mediterranea]|uniref:Multidrug resistance protein MdtN n=1 Tax=Botrimarina mediterranea TaxID=2528022 RepID=A0A518KCW6_9BACT|nr:HlyD family efflux transporter periplasmic adaptor subunit [Botrimarina mediterranea]QDV75640.1 multidrug resistance protein MdtN [Botrimarina mediterranea]QDV80275.1 multidrug resistance protein MdtN [Planctomycetes bacterium K2D]